MSEFDATPPPVDFRLLVQGFVGQAFVALGKLPHPVTGETAVEMEWARYFIDVLGMLEEKTSGNLSSEESSFLEHQLHTLRLNFVDVQRGGNGSGAGGEIGGESSGETTGESNGE